jgi:hypothetical protein
VEHSIIYSEHTHTLQFLLGGEHFRGHIFQNCLLQTCSGQLFKTYAQSIRLPMPGAYIRILSGEKTVEGIHQELIAGSVVFLPGEHDVGELDDGCVYSYVCAYIYPLVATRNTLHRTIFPFFHGLRLTIGVSCEIQNSSL